METRRIKLKTDGRKKSIHVVIVDDHRLVREGIVSQINRGYRIKVVGEASNGAELFHLLSGIQADVVLLDVQMPEMNGPQTLRRLQAEYPHINVLVISMFTDKRIIKEMLNLGACGFINKDIGGEELIDAIYNTNFRGRHAQNDEMRAIFASLDDVKSIKPDLENITPIRLKHRDLNILCMICEGFTSEEIAVEVDLSKQSVDLIRLNLSLISTPETWLIW